MLRLGSEGWMRGWCVVGLEYPDERFELSVSVIRRCCIS